MKKYCVITFKRNVAIKSKGLGKMKVFKKGEMYAPDFRCENNVTGKLAFVFGTDKDNEDFFLVEERDCHFVEMNKREWLAFIQNHAGPEYAVL